jgi:hypothetical protein
MDFSRNNLAGAGKGLAIWQIYLLAQRRQVHAAAEKSVRGPWSWRRNRQR